MRYLSLVTLLCVGMMGCVQAKPITTASLLDEMTNLYRLTKYPDPAYTTKQFSSYDRGAKSPTENWFANGDCGQYLRVEEKNGRKEHVMMDADGPGVVFRIWSANPEGTLRVYLDNNETPAIEADMGKLLRAKMPEFPTPLSGERARGCNLYFPIAYAQHCKITSDKGNFYYQVNYRTYEEGTQITTYVPDDLTRHADKIKDVADRLSDTRRGGGPPAHRKKTPFDAVLEPNDEATLSELDGPLAICGFLAHLDAKDLTVAARNVVLYMTFDGEKTVECPIGDFFGTAPGLVPYASLPLGITEAKPQDMWCHWWMPFEKHSKITVKNLGQQKVRVYGAVARVPYKWDDRSMLFHAKWRIQRDLPSRPMSDWTHLDCKGKGRFVGTSLHVINPVKAWWGEGDEKIYVDGETFPSHFGTGSEDYFGYAWCCNERFVHAYHNQPNCDGPGNFGNTSVNRFHVIDDIPFTTSFKFDMENWHSHDNTKTHRAAVSYWYAMPGGRDFFKSITQADARFNKVEPLKTHRVKGAIEGEDLKVINKTGGNLHKQHLGEKCSNERHLWWRDGKPGDKLIVGFEAKQAGRKHVLVRMVKAHDYGIVQLSVNNKKMGQPIDLYGQGVTMTGEIDLGAVELKKGQNTLTAEITGANEKAVKSYMFGLDYILLK